MLKVFSDDAWSDYLQWQAMDRKTLKRINALIRDIDRNGAAEGIGMPEPLRGNLSGYWSRRIDQTNRLVYRVRGDAERRIEIIACRTHYGDR
ncbi:Txe/YoeB family addiction module toxin [Bifidobacterium avesanii]|uniref:Endoribonuclease YoeB n=1 Tax=Bifidobacterium avesanii TaxID=1798157 RepID=A0A7K3TK94_9BIFI|nr:Txe/YoeB family addiction module toxin [Bifidobacterium avesanii]KAB8286683.1 addiction module protein [Bifidobacterium avesanii]NEG79376.1 Txe/YoeB family addiction module toxin [Bifidobacterium avesanii]